MFLNVPVSAIFPRSTLSRLLFGKLRDSVETIFGDEIVALEQETDCVRVVLEHAGGRRFDLLIGADGLHSAVRKLAFGPPGSRNVLATPSRRSRLRAIARAMRTSI